MKVKKAAILLMILKILCQRIQIQRYLITQKKTWNQSYSCCSNCRIMMPLPHSFHYTISKGHKNEYFSTKKKKNLVPKNQNFNTRSYLTSKNSKRSMNTTLLYNNNLNDENSKPKQKQSGSSSASSSSCTTSTSSTASSTIGHFRSHSP